MRDLLALAIFWGVWLLVPLLVDGLTMVVSLAGVLVMRWRRRTRRRLQGYWPRVSIIVPVYNSATTLEACLRSIAAQDYPHELLEIWLINNGSHDDSGAVFNRLQAELDVWLGWHSILNQGKAWALNAGIHLARGQYIINLDSDVVLAPEAVRHAIEVMEAEPDLGAATGAIQVLSPPAGATPWQRILAACEFLEYLTAFHVGREHQTLLQSLYTLSGAFSIFRREVLLQTFLYSQETVTEDTDLTFELYERFRDQRIGCISTAIAYVHPIESWSALYAQRVRWQRGQIEVSARHEQLLRRSWWRWRGFSPARILLVDHTLSFPRFAWTLLLPVLVLFGYPLSLLVLVAFVLYGFYVLIDVLWSGVAWLGTDAIARRRLQSMWWLPVLMPAYRMVVFWFRFSGFLHAVAEPGVWRVQDPVAQIRSGWHNTLQAGRRLYSLGRRR